MVPFNQLQQINHIKKCPDECYAGSVTSKATISRFLTGLMSSEGDEHSERSKKAARKKTKRYLVK